MAKNMFAIIPTLIFGLIIYFIIRPRDKKNNFILGFDSKEDALSQIAFLLATAFFGIFLYSLSKRIGSDLFDWKTVILLTAIFSAFIAYYFKAVISLVFAIPTFIVWWGSSSGFWIEKYEVKPIIALSALGLVCVCLFLKGRMLELLSGTREIFKKFSVVYYVMGILSTLFLVMFFSMEFGLRGIEEMSQGKAIFASWQLALWLIIFAAGLIGLIIYLAIKDKDRVITHELAGAGVLGILFATLPFLPEQKLFISSQSSYYGSEQMGILSRVTPAGFFWLILFNLLALFLCLGIIFIGYLRKENWMVNLGALSLGFLILIKYFDWFYSSMDKSLFFLVGGVLLFVIGWVMDRSRKKLLVE